MLSRGEKIRPKTLRLAFLFVPGWTKDSCHANVSNGIPGLCLPRNCSEGNITHLSKRSSGMLVSEVFPCFRMIPPTNTALHAPGHGHSERPSLSGWSVPLWRPVDQRTAEPASLCCREGPRFLPACSEHRVETLGCRVKTYWQHKDEMSQPPGPR